MRIEVVVRSRVASDEPGERYEFELAPGDEVVFGRSSSADVLVPDPERRVSGRHGRVLHASSGGLCAEDLGSLNGTSLDGEPLVAGQPRPLAVGGTLQVGDYVIELLAAEPAAEPAAAAESADPIGELTMVTDVFGASGQRLAAALDSAYDHSVERGRAAVDGALGAEVDRAIAELSRPHAIALLESLLDDAGDPAAAAAALRSAGVPGATVGASAAAPATEPAPLPDASAGAGEGGAALRALQHVADRLVPGRVLADQECEPFGELLTHVVQATLAWLAKGLQGRVAFAQEFGAEVTLVFQRSNNPLKAMTVEQLREYLLDWQGDVPADQRMHYLDGLLKDMTDHQAGVLAGVEQAIADLLLRLSPARIEALAAEAKGWSKQQRLWGTYQRVHQELSAEQEKLFHELLAPAIQKGYLHRHDGG